MINCVKAKKYFKFDSFTEKWGINQIKFWGFCVATRERRVERQLAPASYWEPNKVQNQPKYSVLIDDNEKHKIYSGDSWFSDTKDKKMFMFCTHYFDLFFHFPFDNVGYYTW